MCIYISQAEREGEKREVKKGKKIIVRYEKIKFLILFFSQSFEISHN